MKSLTESLNNAAMNEASVDMNGVAAWYQSTRPNDRAGKQLNPQMTFTHLWAYMNAGCDFYIIMNCGESDIREAIFTELARRLNTSYDNVYNVWLHKQMNMKIYEVPAK